MKKIIEQLFLFFIIIHFYNGDSIQFPTATKYKITTGLFYSSISIQKKIGPFLVEILKMNTEDIKNIEIIT